MQFQQARLEAYFDALRAPVHFPFKYNGLIGAISGDRQVKKARSNFAESFSHCPVRPEEATMVD